MTQEQFNAAIIKLIKIAVDNQPGYLYEQLLQRGMVGQYLPVGSELESKMNDIYISNPQDFFTILRGMKYDPTVTNYSTNQESTSYLRLLANNLGIASPNSKLDLGNIWDTIVGTLAGKSTSTTSPTTTTTTGANIAAIIGLVLVAGLLVTIVYFAFFKNN